MEQHKRIETEYCKYMSVQEFKAMRSWIFSRIHSPPMLMLFLVTAYTGTPPIDSCKLKLSDLNSDLSRANIIRQKTKRPYIVRFPSVISQALEIYISTYQDLFINDYLFYPSTRNQSKNEHITPGSLGTVFSRMRKDLGLMERYYTTRNGIDLHRITLYTLRHFFAQRIFETSGNDIMKVKESLGHKKISTTQKYLKGFQDPKEEQLLLDKIFKI